MLPETQEAIKAELSEAKSAALASFIQELLEILKSEGFTFADLIEATAAHADKLSIELDSVRLKEVTKQLEKAALALSK